MVSAVEQMAANTSWSALGKAKDLRNRILFTLGLLCVYRLGTFIPVQGIDGAALREFMEQAVQHMVDSGLNITRLNFEVAPGQAEFQIMNAGTANQKGILKHRSI